MRREDRVRKELRDGEALEAMAKRLAQTLHDPETPATAQAAVARELRMVLKDIAAAPKTQQGDKLDELTARRKAHLAS